MYIITQKQCFVKETFQLWRKIVQLHAFDHYILCNTYKSLLKSFNNFTNSLFDIAACLVDY